MLFVLPLWASSAATTVTVCNEQSDFRAAYVSSLVYRSPFKDPIEYEIQHYDRETGNTASQSVSGGLSSEREAWAPATPFHGWSVEEIKTAAGCSIRVSHPFSAIDRGGFTPTPQWHGPSKQQEWVRRRIK
jgi:hypothetical protein